MVEAATGGQGTVLYTAQGAPSYFLVVPKCNLEDIDPALGTGTHPAFIIDGVEVPKLFIGMHEGFCVNGELLALPGVAPTVLITPEQANTYARSCGPGFHVMSNVEWALIALALARVGVLPSGNTNMGKHHVYGHECGVRLDGRAPGDAAGFGTVLTGSGPNSWRSGNFPSGLSNLVGNVREYVSGVRLVDGELQVMPNNDAAAETGSHATSTRWKAVDFVTGALVTPGSAGTVKMNSGAGVSGSPPQNVGYFAWAATMTNQLGPAHSSASLDYNRMPWTAVNATGPTILKTLGLAPHFTENMDLTERVEGRNYGTRYFARGGHAGDNDAAGLFAWSAFYSTDSQQNWLGARICKY